MEFLILIILVFFLSYANGQMIFKKEYALVGNSVTDYKIAILWGILWTAIGFACLLWGLNDTPKIAVIIIYSSLSTNKWVFILITLSMAIGGYLYRFKTTETLSYKITRMDHVEGFTSNLIVSILVSSASYLGLPLSTTHVSSTAIIASGIKKGKESVNSKIISEILLAWLVTIPASALISTFVYLIIRLL